MGTMSVSSPARTSSIASDALSAVYRIVGPRRCQRPDAIVPPIPVSVSKSEMRHRITSGEHAEPGPHQQFVDRHAPRRWSPSCRSGNRRRTGAWGGAATPSPPAATRTSSVTVSRIVTNALRRSLSRALRRPRSLRRRSSVRRGAMTRLRSAMVMAGIGDRGRAAPSPAGRARPPAPAPAPALSRTRRA